MSGTVGQSTIYAAKYQSINATTYCIDKSAAPHPSYQKLIASVIKSINQHKTKHGSVRVTIQQFEHNIICNANTRSPLIA